VLLEVWPDYQLCVCVCVLLLKAATNGPFVCIQIEVIEGSLVCPETNRVFPIVNGIPNMLLADDEI